jgi:phasin family protein
MQHHKLQGNKTNGRLGFVLRPRCTKRDPVTSTNKDKNMTPNYTDFAAFNQEALDAIVKTNTAAVKGYEAMTKYFVDLAGKSFEDAVAASKKLAGAKTVVELVQIQTKLAQESIEVAMEEGKKVSELTTAIVKDVTAPLTERFKNGVAVATKVAKKAA